jgi:hypothetical protein
VEGELTDWFEVKSDLRQGCLLSLGLFNVFMESVVNRVLMSMNHGVRVEYRLTCVLRRRCAWNFLTRLEQATQEA